MLCGLVLLLLLGAGYLKIPRRSVLFGIATGFAVFTSAKVILDNIALRQTKNNLALSRANSSIYLCACLIWLGYSIWGEKLPFVAEKVATGARPDSDGALAVENRPLLDTLDEMVEDRVRGNQTL